MIGIAPFLYDINGGMILKVDPTGDSTSGGQRRLGKTQLVDGGVTIYDGGFNAADTEYDITVNPHTASEFDRIQGWCESGTRLTLSLYQGVYRGIIESYRQRGSQLNFKFSVIGIGGNNG